MTSAYPPSIDALLPRARRLAEQLGQLPSRNKTMAELNIGRGKANAVLTQLRAERGEQAPVPPQTRPHPQAAPAHAERPLHLVPNADTADTADLTAIPEGADAPAPNADDGGKVTDLADAEPLPVDDQTPAPPAGAALGSWARRMRTALTPPRTADTTPVSSGTGRAARRWPLLLLAAPAFVAIWSGWVGLGALTGFGPVHPLPGIANGFSINTAITLPIGVETYAAYALKIWLAGTRSARARRFAKWSALGALALGVAGQIAYHLMTAWHVTVAPWPITAAVACLPVIVLGLGAGLAHLQHVTDDPHTEDPTTETRT